MKNAFQCWALVLLLSASTAQAGKIVLANDANALHEGFDFAPDTTAFAQHVASYFTNGSAGRFHAYSFEYDNPAMAAAMAAAGHEWSEGFGIPSDLATLLTFDGIFLAQDQFDNQTLIAYVNAGGNVYIAGGARGNPAEEAGQWAVFLNAFGLSLTSTQYNGLLGVIPIASEHPIFSDVSGLYHNNGQDVMVVNPSNPMTAVVASFDGHSLFAVYDSMDANITVTPQSFDFGNVKVGSTASTAFAIQSTGASELLLGSVGASNPLGPPFAIAADSCSAQAIPPGSACEVTVEFAPDAIGNAADMFDIPSNDPGQPSVPVSVKGYGLSLGGSVTGMHPGSVVCRNLRTGQTLTISQQGRKKWDCEAQGLVVAPGDRVQMQVTGRVESP